jgi:hypothetical protein
LKEIVMRIIALGLLILLAVLGTAGLAHAETWTMEYVQCGGTLNPAYLYVEGTYGFFFYQFPNDVRVVRKRAGNWEPVGQYGQVLIPGGIPPINFGIINGQCLDKAYAVPNGNQPPWVTENYGTLDELLSVLQSLPYDAQTRAKIVTVNDGKKGQTQYILVHP